MRLFHHLPAVLLLGLFTGSTDAAVLDFESVAHEGTVRAVGQVYEEDGFRLTRGADDPLSFAAIGAADFRYFGSTHLLNHYGPAAQALRRADGGAFALRSIDLSELNGSHRIKLQFLGRTEAGETVRQSFALDGRFGFETFHFDRSFARVISVKWAQSQDTLAHMFDNIVVDAASAPPAPVPLPASVLGLVLGLSGLTGLRACRKQGQVASSSN